MSTSVDSHRGAGSSGEDGEPDDVTAPLRRPGPEDPSTDRLPVPDGGWRGGAGSGGWFESATPPSPPAAPGAGSDGSAASDGVGPDGPDAPDDGAPTGAAPTGAAPTGAAPDGDAATGAAPDGDAAPTDEDPGPGTARRRRSRGLRVPSAPAGVAAGEPTPGPPVTGVTATGRPRPTPGPRPTPAPRPTGTHPSSGSDPGLPVGGPPAPSTPKEPPKKHTAALGRLALVLVLVAAVVGTVVVLQQRSQFGRTDAGAEEIPALEVAPAQVDLNTVGQPNAIAPPSALLPGTTATPQAGRPPTISAWAGGLAPRTNIPPIALQAYGMADLAMKKLDPSCHLSWVTLAGLGRIESNHGRYRGASIAPNGAVTPPIIGVPLDGTSGNRAIAGSDGNYDRAEGPMQFIESTWARWGSDGNGDGVADPNNIYDAAFTAGRYLCAGNRDLATGEGWRDAVLSYNFSDDYGRRVYAAAQAYANSTSP